MVHNALDLLQQPGGQGIIKTPFFMRRQLLTAMPFV
jgi:hypothetical protein